MSSASLESVAILGYGRFGRLLAHLFETSIPEIRVLVSSRSNPADGKRFFEREAALRADVVIPAVPIHSFEAEIRAMAGLLQPGQTVMDVCSVKIHPREVMLQHLPEGVDIVCTHPMFGPSTYHSRGKTADGFPIVVEAVRCRNGRYGNVLDWFRRLRLNVVEMGAEEHDRLAARFHFVTLATAGILRELDLKRSRIDTPSATALLDFMEMISVDRDLVRDLYRYNPYCREQFRRFRSSVEEFFGFLSTPVDQED